MLYFISHLHETSINYLINLPKENNIWLVFGYYDDILDSYKEFTVFVQDDFVKEPFKPFSSIIDEIKLFL